MTARRFSAQRLEADQQSRDPKHVEWVRSFLGLIDELAKYVTEHHKTGLAWNPKVSDATQNLTKLITSTQGGSVADFKLDGPASSASASAPPPPPPPPPGPPPPVAPSAAVGPAAVFAEINKGADITKGLKKVHPSEMTHKNPTLRGNAVVSSGPGACTSTIKLFA